MRPAKVVDDRFSILGIGQNYISVHFFPSTSISVNDTKVFRTKLLTFKTFFDELLTFSAYES